MAALLLLFALYLLLVVVSQAFHHSSIQRGGEIPFRNTSKSKRHVIPWSREYLDEQYEYERRMHGGMPPGEYGMPPGEYGYPMMPPPPPNEYEYDYNNPMPGEYGYNNAVPGGDYDEQGSGYDEGSTYDPAEAYAESPGGGYEPGGGGYTAWTPSDSNGSMEEGEPGNVKQNSMYIQGLLDNLLHQCDLWCVSSTKKSQTQAHNILKQIEQKSNDPDQDVMKAQAMIDYAGMPSKTSLDAELGKTNHAERLKQAEERLKNEDWQSLKKEEEDERKKKDEEERKKGEVDEEKVKAKDGAKEKKSTDNVKMSATSSSKPAKEEKKTEATKKESPTKAPPFVTKTPEPPLDPEQADLSTLARQGTKLEGKKDKGGAVPRKPASTNEPPPIIKSEQWPRPPGPKENNVFYIQELLDDLLFQCDRWIVTGSKTCQVRAHNILKKIETESQNSAQDTLKAQAIIDYAGMPSKTSLDKELGKTNHSERLKQAEERLKWEQYWESQQGQKEEGAKWGKDWEDQNDKGRSALSRRAGNREKPDVMLGSIGSSLKAFADEKKQLQDSMKEKTGSGTAKKVEKALLPVSQQAMENAATKSAELVALAGKGGRFEGESMGIGGLDDVLAEIKRRIWIPLASPPALLEELGISPVRGLLLYGRPGCGKTLLARTIGKILSPARPITVVSGPELMDKYVGSSEKNLREVFDNPPDVYDKSDDALASAALHVVIMDEFDAIARSRGGKGGGGDQGDAGVARDSVVNQLLAKMDGVEALAVPTLVIGLTNKRSLIDSALLRPGRFEVQVEVPPPRTAEQRYSILKVHTEQMLAAGRLAVSDSPTAAGQYPKRSDVSDLPTFDDLLSDLADECKGMTGAELAGVARAAASHALERAVTEFSSDPSHHSMMRECLVTQQDFQQAVTDVFERHSADYGEEDEELGDESEPLKTSDKNVTSEAKETITPPKPIVKEVSAKPVDKDVTSDDKASTSAAKLDVKDVTAKPVVKDVTSDARATSEPSKRIVKDVTAKPVVKDVTSDRQAIGDASKPSFTKDVTSDAKASSKVSKASVKDATSKTSDKEATFFAKEGTADATSKPSEKKAEIAKPAAEASELDKAALDKEVSDALRMAEEAVAMADEELKKGRGFSNKRKGDKGKNKNKKNR